MAEENTKDKSAYIFVDASTTKPDKSYADKPVYSYVYPAWEWLLERTLRRKLILSMFNKDAALAALTLHSGCYRMHRWPAFGNGSGCSSFTDSTHTYDAMCHDGTLKNYAEQLLPSGGAKIRIEQDKVINASLSLDGFNIVLGLSDLANEVYSLIYNPIFLAPNYSPSDEYHVEAILKEKTLLVLKSEDIHDYEWKTTVENHLQYKIPDHPFFLLITDYRVDDPAKEIVVTDSDKETHKVMLPKTIPAIRRENLTELDGKKVLKEGYTGVNLLHSLAFATETSIDNKLKEKLTSDTPFGRSWSHLVNKIHGPIERVDGSMIYAGSSDLLQPDVSWGNDKAPTWWHANGFPVEIDSILSSELKEQLKDLSITQPSIPPNIPYLTRFPKDGEFTYADPNTNFKNWPSGVISIAATPRCIYKMLDSLTTTIIEVPYLFFEIDATTVRNVRYSEESKVNGSVTASWGNTNTESNIKGTLYSDKLTTCDELIKNQNEADYIDETGTSNYSYENGNRESKLEIMTTLTTESTISNVVALRSTRSTKTSIKTKITTKETDYLGKDKTNSTESGSEPTEYTPGESDLMFPDWVRKWIKKATLFMAYESFVSEATPYTTTTTFRYDDSPNSIIGNGHRSTITRKGVVKIGTMDNEGKFGTIDIVKLREATDPSCNESGHSMSGAENIDIIETVDDNNNVISSTETYTKTPGALYWRNGSSGYTSKLFVVVEWDFDKEDPEPFGEQPAERTAWKEAENNLTKANSELEEAKYAKTAAENLVKAKEDELDKAREALDNATGENKQMLQEELDKIQEELDKARKALADAEQTVTDKEQKVEECKKAVTKAKEAFMKLMQEYTGKLR